MARFEKKTLFSDNLLVQEPFMEIKDNKVAILRCLSYERDFLKTAVDRICGAIDFQIRPGCRVLLKPNLVTARSPEGRACTNPWFVAAVAEWFLDHGARVSVGDSPAFGSGVKVMRACGHKDVLKKLPVDLIDLSGPERVKLPCGDFVGISRAVLESDLLINLPRVKAHSQLLVTMAVKNYFGTVVGGRKAWLHLKHGNEPDRFGQVLVDLLAVLPEGITLVDGVTAVHGESHVTGKLYPLGLAAGSRNPVAVDTSFLSILGIDKDRSLLWKECSRRGLLGSRVQDIVYPLLSPQDVKVNDFQVRSQLKSVSFRPERLIIGGIRRVVARILPGING